MMNKAAASIVVLVSLGLLTGCDQISPMMGGGENTSATNEVSLAPDSASEAVEAPAWAFRRKGDALASAIRTRRGAIKTIDLESGFPVISVDPAAGKGAYFAIRLKDDLPDAFSGKLIAIEFRASSPTAASIDVRYNTLADGGATSWQTVKLTQGMKTHRLTLSVPAEAPPRDIDEIRFRLSDPEALYSFSLIRIRLAE